MAARGTLARALLARLAFGILSLLFISFVTFLADELAPGDAALRLVGEKASPAAIENLRREMGLDRPWPVRFGEYIGDVARGDFGRSLLGIREPVSEKIARALPITLTLALAAILLAAGLGIGLGTLAALAENRWPDRAILIFSTLGVTVPNFVLAPILVYVFALQLDVLPQTWEVRRVAPDFYYLLLPTLVLAARPMASLTRLTRASMIDTLQQEYIRLAIAKGVPRLRLTLHHALRNAILPVITAIGTSFGFLLTGSFITETFFAIPGLGKMGIEAIQQRDTPVIQATVLLAGALFIFVNLVVDLILPLLDPRVREAHV